MRWHEILIPSHIISDIYVSKDIWNMNSKIHISLSQETYIIWDLLIPSTLNLYPLSPCTARCYKWGHPHRYRRCQIETSTSSPSPHSSLWTSPSPLKFAVFAKNLFKTNSYFCWHLDKSSPTLVHEVHQGHFFRSLREVEGQRDLLPAQVQCLYPDFLIPSYNYAPLCESNFASL